VIPFPLTVVALFLLAAVLAGTAYLGAAAGCVLAFSRHLRRSDGRPAGENLPVTVLKPLCGPDEGLYRNLRSFCEQDYGTFQVVFGARDGSDPAVAVARRVMADLPGLDAALVTDGSAAGGNPKASTLAGMMPVARHPILAVSDSDMRVGRGYLRAVADPFSDPDVGAVTCLYTGTPAPGLPSALGALHINDWFLPSALVALAFSELKFCFGATMAVRREALAAIGGFEALAPYLADDYRLGEMVSGKGYKVRLSPYLVENVVREESLGKLLSHELRWARTIRSCRPKGYAFSFVASGAMTLALLFTAATGGSGAGWALFGLAASMRLALHYAVRFALRPGGSDAPWLLPLRDALCLGVWAAGLLGRGVSWRERRLSVSADGRLASDRTGGTP
jgi:ceramide glucosyltransferase